MPHNLQLGCLTQPVHFCTQGSAVEHVSAYAFENISASAYLDASQKGIICRSLFMPYTCLHQPLAPVP